MSPLFLSFKRGVRRFEFCVSVINERIKKAPSFRTGQVRLIAIYKLVKVES